MAEETKRGKFEYDGKTQTLTVPHADGTSSQVKVTEFPRNIQEQFLVQGVKTKFSGVRSAEDFAQRLKPLKAGQWAVGPSGRGPSPRTQLARALVAMAAGAGKVYQSAKVDDKGNARSGMTGARLDVAAFSDAQVKAALEKPAVQDALKAADKPKATEKATATDLLK